MLSFMRYSINAHSKPARSNPPSQSRKSAELLKWFFRMESKAVKEGKSIIFNQEFLHDILSLRFTRAERKMINYL